MIIALREEFDVQVSAKAQKIIEYKLGAFSKTSNSERGLEEGLAETLSRINIGEIYNQCKSQFQAAIDSRNLEQLLLIYNRKSLPDRISGIFGLGKGQYEKLLVRLLKGSKQAEIIASLRAYLPNL